MNENMNKLGVNSRLITSLKYQVLLMDHAYMRTGEDHELVVEEENDKRKVNQGLVYVDSDGLIVFNVDSPVYCYFDQSIKSVLYTHSQEFTDRYNNASSVSILYIPANSFSKLIKVK